MTALYPATVAIDESASMRLGARDARHQFHGEQRDSALDGHRQRRRIVQRTQEADHHAAALQLLLVRGGQRVDHGNHIGGGQKFRAMVEMLAPAAW